eukprot:721237-Prorocentrum_minimum.AAC.1
MAVKERREREMQEIHCQLQDQLRRKEEQVGLSLDAGDPLPTVGPTPAEGGTDARDPLPTAGPTPAEGGADGTFTVITSL